MVAKKKEKKKKTHTSDPFLMWVWHVLYSVGYGLLFFFLIANIVMSQYMPDLTFKLYHTGSDVVGEFLRKGKTIPSFHTLSPEVQETMTAHDNEIFAASRKRRAEIDALEYILTINPQSRDALYGLSLLYEEEGDQGKADAYLIAAQSVDPQVGRQDK